MVPEFFKGNRNFNPIGCLCRVEVYIRGVARRGGGHAAGCGGGGGYLIC